jgi:hypothetical protein
MSEPGSLLERARNWLEQTWRQAPPSLRRHWPWFILGGLVAGFLAVFLLRPSGGEPPNGGTEPTVAAAGATGDEAPGHAGQASGSHAAQPPLAPGATADAGPPLSPNVKITFRTVPTRRASVMWGAKRLGFIDRKPLVIERARDSGPLDVVVRAEGFLPVHARAYTFDDATIDVKITPVDKKDTLYGYQQPLTDAGAPPPTE